MDLSRFCKEIGVRNVRVYSAEYKTAVRQSVTLLTLTPINWRTCRELAVCRAKRLFEKKRKRANG